MPVNTLCKKHTHTHTHTFTDGCARHAQRYLYVLMYVCVYKRRSKSCTKSDWTSKFRFKAKWQLFSSIGSREHMHTYINTRVYGTFIYWICIAYVHHQYKYACICINTKIYNIAIVACHRRHWQIANYSNNRVRALSPTLITRSSSSDFRRISFFALFFLFYSFIYHIFFLLIIQVEFYQFVYLHSINEHNA